MAIFKRNGLAGAWILVGVVSWALHGCLPQSRTGLDVAEIKQAAELGDAEAQYQLGVMYGKGEGVPQDNVNAYTWSSMAATHGEAIAARNRDLFAIKLTPEQRSKAEILATKLQAKIDEQTTRPSSLAAPPSSTRPAMVANRVEMRSWLQGIKPAAGGK